MKKFKKIIIACILVTVLGVLYYASLHQTTESATVMDSFVPESTSEVVDEDKEAVLYVHICGEVKNPGVYSFSGDPRIVDVIKKAGGFTKNADKESVNQAQKAEDGMQLVITKKEKKKASTKDKDNRVDLNTATAEELMTLPGIGEAKVKQILSYRQTVGRFQKIQDIMQISGIKEGVFNKIKDYIKVS